MSAIMWGDSQIIAIAFIGTAFWFACILVILYHKRGMEIVGGVLTCAGILALIIYPTTMIPYLLIIAGWLIHGTGRCLHRVPRIRKR